MRAGWGFLCENAESDWLWLRFRLWAPEPLMLSAVKSFCIDSPRRSSVIEPELYEAGTGLVFLRVTRL